MHFKFIVIKKKSYLLFIFKGYLDFRYIILLIVIVKDMFGQGSYSFSRLL